MIYATTHLLLVLINCCSDISNTLHDSSDRVCIPNKHGVNLNYKK